MPTNQTVAIAHNCTIHTKSPDNLLLGLLSPFPRRQYRHFIVFEESHVTNGKLRRNLACCCRRGRLEGEQMLPSCLDVTRYPISLQPSSLAARKAALPRFGIEGTKESSSQRKSVITHSKATLAVCHSQRPPTDPNLL